MFISKKTFYNQKKVEYRCTLKDKEIYFKFITDELI